MDTKKMPQMGNNMYAVLNEKTSQPSSRNSSFKGSSISDKDRVLSSYKSNYDGTYEHFFSFYIYESIVFHDYKP